MRLISASNPRQPNWQVPPSSPPPPTSVWPYFMIIFDTCGSLLQKLLTELGEVSHGPRCYRQVTGWVIVNQYRLANDLSPIRRCTRSTTSNCGQVAKLLCAHDIVCDDYYYTTRLRIDHPSTSIRLQFDRATTIRRPTSRTGCCTAA